MKKLTLLAVVLMTFSVCAQKKFAIFFGMNNSTLTKGIMNGAYIQFSPGIQTGVLYDLELTKKIHFSPKLLYSQQGDRDNTVSNTGYSIADVGYRLSYINASMDFKFWNKVYMIVGPQVGLLVTENPTTLLLDDAKKIDLGANLGIGFRFTDFFFELGTYQGFVPVLDYYEGWGSTARMHNALAKVTLGYYVF